MLVGEKVFCLGGPSFQQSQTWTALEDACSGLWPWREWYRLNFFLLWLYSTLLATCTASHLYPLPISARWQRHRDRCHNVQDACWEAQFYNEVTHVPGHEIEHQSHKNFHRYVPNRDGMIYASYIPSNNTWIGLVGMLQRADADWAFPTISLNAERQTVIDYATVIFWHHMSCHAHSTEEVLRIFFNFAAALCLCQLCRHFSCLAPWETRVLASHSLSFWHVGRFF